MRRFSALLTILLTLAPALTAQPAADSVLVARIYADLACGDVELEAVGARHPAFECGAALAVQAIQALAVPEPPRAGTPGHAGVVVPR